MIRETPICLKNQKWELRFICHLTHASSIHDIGANAPFISLPIWSSVQLGLSLFQTSNFKEVTLRLHWKPWTSHCIKLATNSTIVNLIHNDSVWPGIPFYQHWSTFIPTWIINDSQYKVCDHIIYKFPTLKVQPLKFGNGYVNSPHILLSMWLLTHA